MSGSLFMPDFFHYIQHLAFCKLSLGTCYGNVHVVKALEPLAPCRYYLTLQVRVNICFPEFSTDVLFEKEVELIRIKTAPNPIVIDRQRKALHRSL